MPTDWQTSAIRDLQDSDLSYQEIADKYGRDRNTVVKLKKEHNIVRLSKALRKGSRPMTAVKQLSPAHRALGLRLTVYRGNRNYSDLARELNISRYVAHMMEIGGHDFTLSQLTKISEIMGRSINELIAPHRVSPQ